MRKCIVALLLSCMSLLCSAQVSGLEDQLSALGQLRGTEDFLPKRDSLVAVAKKSSDFEALSQLYLSTVRHYQAVGSLDIKDELKESVETCKQYCVLHPGSVETYFSSWNAYITYLVNHKIFTEAYVEIMKMQDEAIATKEPVGIYTSYVAYGNFYSLKDQYALGAEYYEKAIAYCNDNSIVLTDSSLAPIYSNVSGDYVVLGEYDKAEYSLMKALELSKSEFYKGAYKVNLCLLYQKKGEWDKFLDAFEDIDVSLPYSSATRDKFNELKVAYYIHTQEYDKAIEFANSMDVPAAYSAKASVYSAMGDFKEALTYTQKADSTIISSLGELADLQSQETDRIFDHNRIFMEEQEARNKAFRSVFIVVMSVLTTAILALLLLNHFRAKAARRLKAEHAKTLEAMEQAQKASQMKSLFIRNISHELHTPLHHISGFAQLLSDEEIEVDKETLHEYATTINDSARKLNDMLDHIIEVSDKLSS